MSKELLISLILGALLLLSVILGLVQTSLLSNPFFLLFGLAIILGQVVMAHLAFNQYKSLTTKLTKEGDTHEEGRDGPAEERGTDGFDD